ncbi:MAG: sodium:solute symporter [Planctomycetota bacterium]|nr:sodium:solute symporter [Planctomycetota bacterium]
MNLLTIASSAGGLSSVDWAVLAAYMVLLLVTGVIFSRREQKNTDDYFLGGRRMPVWAVALSIIASSLSVATFIGVPQFSFNGDLTYLSSNIGGVIAILIVALVFIPAFYRANVTSIYELLEHRLGPGAKSAASATFMIGRVFASGARIYIASIPLALLLFGDRGAEQPSWHYIVASIVMVAIGVAYTLVGGIASVIWTEVVQTIVLLGAVAAAIALLLHRIPIGTSEIVTLLDHPSTPGGASKLTLLDTGHAWDKPYTLWTALIGFTLMGLASYGTDHDLAQRMLTCKSAVKGGQSAVVAILLSIPIVAMFMLIGLLLWVFYMRPDVMGSAAPAYQPGDSRKVFLTFILREMPPGLSGVMLAGLLSVGISSLNSALNAMSATAIKDFYMVARPGRPPTHYVAAGRVGVVLWGVALAGFACLCVVWQSSNAANLIDFALGVMTFAYAGLLAVFLTALFTRRGNSVSAIAALVTGFIVIALLQPPVWKAWATFIPLEKGTLADFTLAWPWHLATGVALSTAVCCLGARPPERHGISAASDAQPGNT